MASRLSYRLESGPSGETLHLEGSLDRQVAGELLELLTVRRRRGARVTLDLSKIADMDSAGVGVLVTGWRAARGHGGLELGPVSPTAERALSMFRVGPEPSPPPRPAGFLENLGNGLYGARAATWELLQLAADTTFALLGALLHPRRIR